MWKQNDSSKADIGDIPEICREFLKTLEQRWSVSSKVPGQENSFLSKMKPSTRNLPVFFMNALQNTTFLKSYFYS